MTLSTLKATDFRCFAEASLQLDARANLIVGPNAAGKTSLLEAIAYLGRGKSFRGATAQQTARHGQRQFVVTGTVAEGPVERRLGLSNGRDGLEIRVDGSVQRSAATLAEVLPLQVVDPEVHELVAGGPERRRRYLDWLLFHVEHRYLDVWRRFRRVLRQRNAALKTGGAGGELHSWDQEFAEAGEALNEMRRAAFSDTVEGLEVMTERLLGGRAQFEFRSGWPEEISLLDSLRGARDRDVAQGATQFGPQRADIRLRYDDHLAKRLVSRGQQKLLACSLVLAAVERANQALGRPLLLLLDDPAAELDAQSLARVVAAVQALDCQVVATALTLDRPILSSEHRVFHVEHGQVSNAV